MPKYSTTQTSSTYLPPDSVTLLHIAAFCDSLEVFIYLHDHHHIPFQIKSAAQYFPLHYACYAGSYEVARYILENDPQEARLETITQFSLIFLATYSHNSEILKLLLKNGANINDQVCKNNNPIGFAINTLNIDILKILLNAGSKTSSDNKAQYSSLMKAVICRAQGAVPLLIQHGEQPEFVSSDYQTALSLACFINQPEIVKYLCDHMTQVDLDPSIHQKAAVHWICSSRNPEIVKIVLQKGINVNRLDDQGHSGVHYLLDTPDQKVVINILQQLLDNGLNINLQGKTPGGGITNSILGDFCESITRQPTVIEWLLAHGADPYAKTSNNKTIFEKVTKARKRDLLKIFNAYIENPPKSVIPEALYKPHLPKVIK